MFVQMAPVTGLIFGGAKLLLEGILGFKRGRA